MAEATQERFTALSNFLTVPLKLTFWECSIINSVIKCTVLLQAAGSMARKVSSPGYAAFTLLDLLASVN